MIRRPPPFLVTAFVDFVQQLRGKRIIRGII
jgi:hypothetical protein